MHSPAACRRKHFVWPVVYASVMPRGEAVKTAKGLGLRRRRGTWALLAGGLAILVVGIVVFAQSTSDKGAAPTPAPVQAAADPDPAPASREEPLRKGGTLDAAARTVVERFAAATLNRTDLAAAWDLATGDVRGGVTREQWMRGELPIAPYPLDTLQTTGFQVVESNTKKVLLTILLVPRPDSEYTPIRYDMTLERTSRGAPWKVSYFLPYAPPGMYSDKAS
jgi:hypothetical protein